MLITKTIEGIIKSKIQTALTTNHIEGISFISCWEDTSEGEPKGEEDSSQGIITLKANLPTFDTPTIPDCVITTEINFVSRTDADYTGKNYLAVSEVIYDILLGWQKSFSNVSSDFTTEVFEPTGFQITSSDCGLDKIEGLWTLAITVNILGIYTIN